jgi:hypothetical protein
MIEHCNRCSSAADGRLQGSAAPGASTIITTFSGLTVYGVVQHDRALALRDALKRSGRLLVCVPCMMPVAPVLQARHVLPICYFAYKYHATQEQYVYLLPLRPAAEAYNTCTSHVIQGCLFLCSCNSCTAAVGKIQLPHIIRSYSMNATGSSGALDFRIVCSSRVCQ